MPPKRTAYHNARLPRPSPPHQDPDVAGALPFSTTYFGVRICFFRRDILTLPADIIVNPANASLRGGGGLDGHFHRAAGPGMMDELIREYPNGGRTGHAYVTGPHNIQSVKYVIHAVGPNYRTARTVEQQRQAERLLRCLYDEILELALNRGATSIALPTISTGIFGFPPNPAAEIALDAVKTFIIRRATPPFAQIAFVFWPPGNEDEDIYRMLYPIFFGPFVRSPQNRDLGGLPNLDDAGGQDAYSPGEDRDKHPSLDNIKSDGDSGDVHFKNEDNSRDVHFKNEDNSGDVHYSGDVHFKNEDNLGDVHNPTNILKAEEHSQNEDNVKSESASPIRLSSQRSTGNTQLTSHEPRFSSPSSPSSSSPDSSSSDSGSDNDRFILGPNARVPPLPFPPPSSVSITQTTSSDPSDEEEEDETPAKCVGITKSGARCKRHPKRGDLYCYSHTDQA